LSGRSSLGSIRRPEKPAPVLHPSNSGAKPEKDFRIQDVINLIIVFTMNRKLEPSYPLYYV
jgi:hypothetical protein